MVDQELISAIRKVVSEEVNGLKEGQESLRKEVNGLKEGQESLIVGQESLRKEVNGLKKEQERLRIELGYTNKKLDQIERNVDRIEEQLGLFKEETNDRFSTIHKGLSNIHDQYATVNERMNNIVVEQNQMRKVMKEGFKELNISIQSVYALAQMDQLQIQEHEEKYHKREKKLVV